MKISFSKEPLRLILGGILLVIGILSLLSISFPLSGIIFTVAGIITGILLVLKTPYL